MSELKIPEVILNQRHKKKLTQEELAQALGVSGQAISNWERGGYPDITLLPRIANFFRITVDELIGNDELSREADVDSFFTKLSKIPKTKAGYAERFELALEYYHKYPNNYDIIEMLGEIIINLMDRIEENMPLLRELHNKTMNECTEEERRKRSMHRMCVAANDDELYDMLEKCELNWEEALAMGEIREERFKLRGRWEEFYRERNCNDLLTFMHYLGRNNMCFYERENDYVYAEPKRSAAWESHKMRLLEGFSADGKVPDAWKGCYAESCLRYSCALIGSGKVDEGFDMFEKTFELYDEWLKIPKGTLLDAGDPELFGGSRITKCDDDFIVDIVTPDGKKTWTTYLWLFWQKGNDVLRALNEYKWLDGVRDDERFISLHKRAKEMSEQG